MALDEIRAADIIALTTPQLGRVPPEARPGTDTLAGRLLVAAANGPLAGETLNYKFDLVNFDYRTWHEYEWGNWVAVDALLHAAFRGVAEVQVWTTLHGYLQEDVVVSTETGLAYECLVNHTSNATSILPDIALGYWSETIIGDSYTKDEADIRFINADGDTMSGALTLFGDPTAPQHAADKQYVDLLDANQKAYIDAANAAQDTTMATYMPKSGGVFSGAPSWVPSPTVASHLANKLYVDAQVATANGNANSRVLKAGDTMTGLLVLSGAPTVDLHAVTKKYVDDKNTTQDASISANTTTATNAASAAAAANTNANSRVLKAGDTMTGPLILPAAAPTLGTHAANKSYVDAAIAGAAAAVVVSATPPASPGNGALWYALAAPVGMFVWVNDGNTTQWVAVDGSASSGSATPDYYTKAEADARYVDVTGDTITGALLIENTGPTLRFHESDATEPKGRWQFQAGASGGVLGVYNATATDWSTTTTFMQLAASGYNSVLYDRININVPLGAMLTVKYTTPEIRFDESDAVAPAGQYRFYTNSDVIYFQRALTADHATNTTIWSYDGAAPVFNVAGMGVIGNVNINRDRGGGSSSGRISATSGGISIQSQDSSSFIFTYLNTTLTGRFDAAGTTAPVQTYSVVTKEKGDARYTAISSRRYKENIEAQPVNALIHAFDHLVPHQWIWGGEIADGDERKGRVGIGFIAEEVADIIPAAVTRRYKTLPPVLLENGEQDPDAPTTSTELQIDGLDHGALIAVLAAKIKQIEAQLVAIHVVEQTRDRLQGET